MSGPLFCLCGKDLEGPDACTNLDHGQPWCATEFVPLADCTCPDGLGEKWDATPEEREAANERLRQAKEWGAFTPDIPPAVLAVALRAIATEGAA